MDKARVKAEVEELLTRLQARLLRADILAWIAAFMAAVASVCLGVALFRWLVQPGDAGMVGSIFLCIVVSIFGGGLLMLLAAGITGATCLRTIERYGASAYRARFPEGSAERKIADAIVRSDYLNIPDSTLYSAANVLNVLHVSERDWLLLQPKELFRVAFVEYGSGGTVSVGELVFADKVVCFLRHASHWTVPSEAEVVRDLREKYESDSGFLGTGRGWISMALAFGVIFPLSIVLDWKHVDIVIPFLGDFFNFKWMLFFVVWFGLAKLIDIAMVLGFRAFRAKSTEAKRDSVLRKGMHKPFEYDAVMQLWRRKWIQASRLSTNRLILTCFDDSRIAFRLYTDADRRTLSHQISGYIDETRNREKEGLCAAGSSDVEAVAEAPETTDRKTPKTPSCCEDNKAPEAGLRPAIPRRSVSIVFCPHCGTRVVPMAGGICPSCRQTMETETAD